MKETILQLKEFKDLYDKYKSKLELKDNNASFNLFIYDLALFWFYMMDEKYKNITKDVIKIEYKEASHLGFHNIKNGHFLCVLFKDVYGDGLTLYDKEKLILKSFEDKYL